MDQVQIAERPSGAQALANGQQLGVRFTGGGREDHHAVGQPLGERVEGLAEVAEQHAEVPRGAGRGPAEQRRRHQVGARQRVANRRQQEFPSAHVACHTWLDPSRAGKSSAGGRRLRPVLAKRLAVAARKWTAQLD